MIYARGLAFHVNPSEGEQQASSVYISFTPGTRSALIAMGKTFRFQERKKVGQSLNGDLHCLLDALRLRHQRNPANLI